MKTLLSLIFRFLTFFPDCVVIRLGKILGWILQYVIRFRESVVDKNLTIVYKGRVPKGLKEKIYRHFGLLIIELMQHPKLSNEKIAKRVSFEGEDKYLKAVEKGKGVLLVSGHYANWETAGVRIAQLGNPVSVVVKDMKNVDSDLLNYFLRETHGVKAIPKNNKVLLSVFRSLKKGETVFMVVDQNAKRSDGCFVDFFDEVCSTYSSPAIVGAKTGAAVLPAFAYRNEDLISQTVRFHEPLYFDRKESDKEAMTANTQKIISFFEHDLKEKPEAWIWMHQRWRTRPLEEKESGNLKIDYSGTTASIPK